jgi:DNA-binding ferritin-like protein
MAAKKKSASRKSAGKKAAKTRKVRAAAKKKVAKTPKKRAAKKAAATHRAPPPAVPAAVAEIDERIAIVRDNLRELTEQAAASSGASTEELLSDRIAEREAQLRLLIKEREKRVRGR